jgi:hypothetical protein
MSGSGHAKPQYVKVVPHPIEQDEDEAPGFHEVNKNRMTYILRG